MPWHFLTFSSICRSSAWPLMRSLQFLRQKKQQNLIQITYRNPRFWSFVVVLFVWLGDSNWQNTICRHCLRFWGASCHNQPFSMAFLIFLMRFLSKFYSHHFWESFSDGSFWPIINLHHWVDFQNCFQRPEFPNQKIQGLAVSSDLKSPWNTPESQRQ